MGDDQKALLGRVWITIFVMMQIILTNQWITVFNVNKLKVTDGNKHNCLDLFCFEETDVSLVHSVRLY